MANSCSAISAPQGVAFVIDIADAKTRFRINNATGQSLNVRLAAADPGPTTGTADFWIPAGLQYFSDYGEYSGEIRGYSSVGGVIGYSKDV